MNAKHSAAVLLAMAALGFAAGPATATTSRTGTTPIPPSVLTHHDATGDMLYWRDTRDFVPTDPADVRRAPNRTESDIAWIRTTFGPCPAGGCPVHLRVHFRELRRSSAKFITFQVQGASATVINGSVLVGSPGDDSYTDQGVQSATIPAGVTYRLDYDTNDFYLTVPAKLLGYERWVRDSFRIQATYVTGYDPYWIDDAYAGYTGYRGNLRNRTYGTYGPRVMLP